MGPTYEDLWRLPSWILQHLPYQGNRDGTSAGEREPIQGARELCNGFVAAFDLLRSIIQHFGGNAQLAVGELFGGADLEGFEQSTSVPPSLLYASLVRPSRCAPTLCRELGRGEGPCLSSWERRCK